MSPNAWLGGGGGVSANEYSCAHGTQINFGDLTSYLYYCFRIFHSCAALPRMLYYIEDLLVYPYCCCSAENLRNAAKPRFEPGKCLATGRRSSSLTAPPRLICWPCLCNGRYLTTLKVFFLFSSTDPYIDNTAMRHCGSESSSSEIG
jgi:hypothetical protein